MTDFIDQTVEREALQLDIDLENQIKRSGLRGKTLDDSALNCRICDSPIPMPRREAVLGVQTRVICQTSLERGAR